jgi:hypothetical protein
LYFTFYQQFTLIMIKKILLVGVLLAAIGGIYGYFLWNKKAGDTAAKKTDLIISASDLATKYEDALYLGKIVQVKGKVSTVETENGIMTITLDSGDPMAAVTCQIEEGTTPPSVTEGNEVTFKCQCDGKLSDVVLTRCVAVQ